MLKVRTQSLGPKGNHRFRVFVRDGDMRRQRTIQLRTGNGFNYPRPHAMAARMALREVYGPGHFDLTETGVTSDGFRYDA